jgi:hypothetical protein
METLILIFFSTFRVMLILLRAHSAKDEPLKESNHTSAVLKLCKGSPSSLVTSQWPYIFDI